MLLEQIWQAHVSILIKFQNEEKAWSNGNTDTYYSFPKFNIKVKQGRGQESKTTRGLITESPIQWTNLPASAVAINFNFCRLQKYFSVK